ncbi:diaminopimelate epimerase [Neobacillus dielmonensis]|uniref:diaminopimelate epimerase n=1 Tax=Neobacillus dielmonensis TaxID=1347369 RepID=UPI0005AB2331|nr:diaminopimelate epimerase [Neobacillus dielmonensis]
MKLDIIKGHGSGNDFFLVDEFTTGYSFTETERSELAKLLCNRETSLGADGVLYIMNSERADGKMRVFNADGSEASMCGNGLRLAARYLCESKGLDHAVVETMKADLKVSKYKELYPDIQTYQVEISPVLFDLKALPLNLPQPVLMNERIPQLSEELEFTAVAVPNPHLITLVDTVTLKSDTQKLLSEKVNGPNQLFPDGVNVSFVKVLQTGEIYVRTFERGVGFTNACGTAMSASSLVTCLQQLNQFETAIDVYNNGGKVKCIVHQQGKNYRIDLIGNATYLFNASVDVDFDKGAFAVLSKKDLAEQSSYNRLQSEVQEYLMANLEG